MDIHINLKKIATLAAVFSLGSCAKPVVKEPSPTSGENTITHRQHIAAYADAVEFTSMKDPSKSCVAIVSPDSYYRGGGGLACFDTKAPVSSPAAPPAP